VKAQLFLVSLAACACLASCGSPTDKASAPATAKNGSTQIEKVSANTASENEIAVALTAAGVPNAKRWAEEVVEYRPYAANDSNLTRLRQNLAKYEPGQETVDKIVGALTP
jgi:hypothetical protein